MELKHGADNKECCVMSHAHRWVCLTHVDSKSSLYQRNPTSDPAAWVWGHDPQQRLGVFTNHRTSTAVGNKAKQKKTGSLVMSFSPPVFHERAKALLLTTVLPWSSVCGEKFGFVFIWRGSAGIVRHQPIKSLAAAESLWNVLFVGRR